MILFPNAQTDPASRSQAPGDPAGSFSIEPAEYSKWLPPPDVWRINPYDKSQKIDTPVDEHGLVDIGRHIELIKAAVEPEYRWPSRLLSVHHKYWNGQWYGFPSAGPNACIFRELPINKVLVPKVFENFLHIISRQPDIPHPDVMHEVIASYEVTQELFRSMQAAIRYQRGRERGMAIREQRLRAKGVVLPLEYHEEDSLGRTTLLEAWSRYFGDIDAGMTRLESVDPTFRLIEPDRAVLESSARFRKYSGALGRIVVPRAIAMTRPIVAAA